MGTNYYANKDFCEHCGRGSEFYHIGKSSGGWCFALHVDRCEGVNNLGDLIEILKQPDVVITDEYNKKISLAEMKVIITERTWRESRKVPYGYSSFKEFYELNEAVKGPNGLFRSKVDGSHCVGHGDGTYDYITGDFS